MSNTLDFVEPYPGWAEESKGRLILGVTGAMTGLAFLFVSARIYSRMISLGRLGVDDYILIISIVSASARTRQAIQFVLLTSSPRHSF
jgi:hypothetical protein